MFAQGVGHSMTYDEQLRYIRRWVRTSGRIAAIKALRETTGLTFRSARAMVDETIARKPWCIPSRAK